MEILSTLIFHSQLLAADFIQDENITEQNMASHVFSRYCSQSSSTTIAALKHVSELRMKRIINGGSRCLSSRISVSPKPTTSIRNHSHMTTTNYILNQTAATISSSSLPLSSSTRRPQQEKLHGLRFASSSAALEEEDKPAKRRNTLQTKNPIILVRFRVEGMCSIIVDVYTIRLTSA